MVFTSLIHKSGLTNILGEWCSRDGGGCRKMLHSLAALSVSIASRVRRAKACLAKVHHVSPRYESRSHRRNLLRMQAPTNHFLP